MACPYFLESDPNTASMAQCLGPLEPFMPAKVDQTGTCSTNQYQHCVVYRFASMPSLLHISREAERAVG